MPALPTRPKKKTSTLGVDVFNVSSGRRLVVLSRVVVLSVDSLLHHLFLLLGRLFVIHTSTDFLENASTLELLLEPAQRAVNRFSFFNFDNQHVNLPPFRVNIGCKGMCLPVTFQTPLPLNPC